MKVKLTKIKENPDGSADVDVTFDKEGLEFIIERGVNALLVEAVMTQVNGELYAISDILGTIPKKSGKGRSNKSMAKIKPSGKD